MNTANRSWRKPKRIQRKRTKGWKMPDRRRAVYVGRPTIWGNPFKITHARAAGYVGSDQVLRAMCAGMFADWLAGKEAGPDSWKERRRTILARIDDLRGKDLVCWCPAGSACHADVLLQLANERPT